MAVSAVIRSSITLQDSRVNFITMVEKDDEDYVNEEASGYYRQAVALEYMGKHPEALAAYCTALARQPKSEMLFDALLQGALKSHLKTILQPQFEQLMQLDDIDKSFATVAIIGQELLSTDEKQSAITVLECALQLGTDEIFLRGSVCSALSSAFWKIGNVNRALHYMHEDLKIVEELGDEVGVSRVYGNLGNAYYAEKSYEEAIQHYKMQLSLAKKLNDRVQTAQALSALGHVYVSVGDYHNALASHKKCSIVRKELNDPLNEAKELGNVATIYALMGDFENAIKCQKENLRLAYSMDKDEYICKALSNMGGLYQNMHQYQAAVASFKEMFNHAQEKRDMITQCQALSGLGHAFRMQGSTKSAERCHEQQLKMAIDLQNHYLEGCAQADMGLNYQQMGDYDKAVEYHKANLSTCRKLGDREGEGMAYGHIGNSYNSLGDYKKSVKYHTLGLSLMQELQCTHAQATLHGNIAFSYQSLEMYDEALRHYEQHADMAKKLNDVRSMCIAYCNLGNFHSDRSNLVEAASNYERFLSTAQTLNDQFEEGRASYKLAHAYYRLKRYDESIQYYEMCIGLSTHIDDTESLAHAYCYLGLAYSSMKDYNKALRCEKFFLATSREKKAVIDVCKALGYLGSIYIKMGENEEGFNQYMEQIKTAENSKNTYLMSDCYHELATVFYTEGKYEDASIWIEKELNLRRGLNDYSTLYQALLTYANILEQLTKLNEAHKIYYELLQLSREQKDIKNFQEICNLMGGVNMKMERYDNAITSFRMQLKCLSEPSSIEAGLVHVRISTCLVKSNDFENAIDHLKNYQKISNSLGDKENLNRAYKKLSEVFQQQRMYKKALMYAEKRLGCVPELTVPDVCDVYQDVAFLHGIVGNHNNAIVYFNTLLERARGEDMEFIYEAYKGLGRSYDLIGNHEEALIAFNNALDVCDKLDDLHRRAETCVFAANQYYRMGKRCEALDLYEKALSTVEDIDSKTLKVVIFGCLGKLYRSNGELTDAEKFFLEAVALSENLTDIKERIKAYYRLGLFYYFTERYEMAQTYFQKVTDFMEQEKQHSVNYYDSDIASFVSSSYQMLQRVLSVLGKPLEALFVAEKNNCMKVEDSLKQTGVLAHVRIPTYEKFTRRLESVSRVISFYSLVANRVCCWLLVPGKGLETFWEKNVIDDVNEDDWVNMDFDDVIMNQFRRTKDKLNSYVVKLRESVSAQPFSQSLSTDSDLMTPDDDIYRKEHSAMKENRSLAISSSLFDQYRHDSLVPTRDPEFQLLKSSWYTDAPLEILYDLLLLENDKYFTKKKHEFGIRSVDLTLNIVVPQELSLITFGILKGRNDDEFFNERYQFSLSPSLFWLLDRSSNETKVGDKKEEAETENIFVLAKWEAESEATDIARIFGATPVMTNTTSRVNIVKRLSECTVCHLSTDVRFRPPSLVIQCNDITEELVHDEPPSTTKLVRTGSNQLEDTAGRQDASKKRRDSFLSVKDISELQLNTKLVSLGMAPYGKYTDAISIEGFHLLITTFLMTGCKTILTCLWPIPQNTRLFFLRHFYYNMFERGMPAHKSFSEAIRQMQSSHSFKHPFNWSGLVIYGQDSKLSVTQCSFVHALHDFLAHPDRDVIKLILHLVEKAKQRLTQGRSSLYVSEDSIKKKMSTESHGWKPLLKGLGFRFEKARRAVPDAIYFPSQEHADVLRAGSNTLYALLGLGENGIRALSGLRTTKNVGKPLLEMLREVLFYYNQDMSNVQVPFPASLWKCPGCHEFLSTLGFDVMGLGKDDVMLRSGKIDMRRQVTCAMQVIQDLFEVKDEETETTSYDPTYVPPNNAVNEQNPSNYSSLRSQKPQHFLYKDGSLSDEVKRRLFPSESEDEDKGYLHSQVGLFGRYSGSYRNLDSMSMLSRSTNSLCSHGSRRTDGGKRYESDTMSVTSYGIKSGGNSRMDMRRYGTMEKLNFNDLVVMETPVLDIDEIIDDDDDWNVSLQCNDGNDVQNTPTKLTAFDNVTVIPNNEQTEEETSCDDGVSDNSKVVNDSELTFEEVVTSSPIRHNDVTKTSTPVHDADEFSESYLRPNQSLERSESSISTLSFDNSKTFNSTGSADDISEEECMKVKPPPEWCRLQLDKSYFDENSPIKTCDIRDSFKLGSSTRTVVECTAVSHLKDGIEKISLEHQERSAEQCNVQGKVSRDKEDRKRNWYNFFQRKITQSTPSIGGKSRSTEHDKMCSDARLDTVINPLSTVGCQRGTGANGFISNDDMRLNEIDYELTSDLQQVYHF